MGKLGQQFTTNGELRTVKLVFYMAVAAKQIGRFWRRYAIVITFPLIAASSIYADYSYTLKCKAKSNMTMLKELQMTWTYVMRNKLLLKMLVPISAGLLGWKLDNMEVERLTLFRDKSALFGRELGVGEKPSWP